MKKLHCFFAGVIACVALASPATAADLGGSIKDTPYAPPPTYVDRPFSWTGLYVGAHVGYGWSQQDWDFALSAVSTNHDGSGWLAGGQIGYNWQIHRLVLGIEGDASSAWIDGSTSCPNPAYSCSHSYDWLASIRGRAGITLNDNRTLLYATAGVAWTDISYATSGVGGVTSLSDRQTGYVVGGGIEHMLTERLSARVEYLYYGFGDITAPAGTLDAGTTRLEPSTQAVRFGLNYKF